MSGDCTSPFFSRRILRYDRETNERRKVLKKFITLRIAVAVLLAGGILAVNGCASQTNQAPTTQTVKVTRGDITTEIVAGGNLELSQKEDLAFQVAGTVAEVLVKQEDSVEKGQVIARLDNSTLEDNVRTAERAVKTAALDLDDAQGNTFQITTAENDLETKTLNFNKLNYPYTNTTFNIDIPHAIDDLVKEQNLMDEAAQSLAKDPQSAEAYGKYNSAELNMADAVETLRRSQSITIYGGTQLSNVISDYQTAKSVLLSMQTSQHNLEQTKRNVQNAIDKAQIALDKANDDLDQAREDLANAVITASFAGFITKVSVLGGDEIQKGTVAAQIADPARFKTTIMVGETDVFKLSENMSASIQVDALPTIILPARVTQIAPTATIQSGVVNYQVEVEADSVQNTTASSAQTAGQTSGQSSNSGQRSFPSQTGTPSQSSGVQGQIGLTQSLAPSATQLREGLSVTLNITVSGKKDILMVPGQAVMRSGKDVQAQVMNNGAVETRVIKTGISNWQYTEVTEGLEEGEEVVIQTVGAAATSTQRGQQGGTINIPGAVTGGSGVRISGSGR